MGVFGYISSSNRLAHVLDLFSCATRATVRKGRHLCGHILFTRQNTILENFDYKHLWQKHKYAQNLLAMQAIKVAEVPDSSRMNAGSPLASISACVI